MEAGGHSSGGANRWFDLGGYLYFVQTTGMSMMYSISDCERTIVFTINLV